MFEEQKKIYPFAKIIYMINIRKQNKKKVKYGKCAQAHVQEVWPKKIYKNMNYKKKSRSYSYIVYVMCLF